MKAMLFSLSILYTGLLFAQDKEKHPLEIKAGLFTNSIPLYHFSTTDTTIRNGMAVGPVLGLYKNGFLVQYNYVLIANELNKGSFMQTLTGSYENYGNWPVDFYTSLSHFFINIRPTVPYTPLDNNFNTYLAYNKTWLKPLASIGFDFGKDLSGIEQSQVNVATGVVHGFEWKQNETHSIELDPSLTLSMGTNQFTTFTQSTGHAVVKTTSGGSSGSSRGRGRGNSGSGSGSTTTTTASSGTTFRLNGFEFGTYSRFVLNNFKIIPQFDIFFPANQNTGSTVSGAWQLEMDYQFALKHRNKESKG
jgi:hypothetical protein